MDKKYHHYAEMLSEILSCQHPREPDLPRQLTLGKGEFRILLLLYKKGECTPGDLSSLLNVGSGRIANALKDLGRKGYITRGKSKEDKRSVTIRLTESGEELARKFSDLFLRKVKSVVDGLGEEDFVKMCALIKKAFQYVREEKNSHV